MSRIPRKASSGGQRPPIVDQISQIIIYDKPNKPQVPEEILKQSRNVKLGQGDIVLTCQDSSEEFAKTVKKNVKRERDEDEEEVVNIKVETVNTEDLSDDPPPTFKKPRGRPKKVESTKEKCTVLNFIMRHSINPDITLDSDASDDTDDNNDQSPRPSRLRRRPARFSYAEDEAEEHYTIDTVTSVLKNRKNSHLLISPIYRSEETEEQDCLDNEVPPSKKNENSPKKPAKKSTAKKANKQGLQKKPDKLQKNIKEEVEEQEEELMDTSNEDLYDSEDGRQEWVPEELVELKQQHIMKPMKNMHKCKFCPKEFATYYGLRKHRVIDHDDMGNVGKKCENYVTMEETEDNDMSKEDSDEETRREWMPQDYAEYKVKHSLNKHKKNILRYNCKICLLKFSTYYQFSKHKMDHQKQANPYECKYCPETFNDIDVFIAHTRVHQGKDPYPCKKCSKTFDSKEALDTHHMTVHVLKKAPPLPKRYRCDVCSKEFAKLGDVERHTRVHTGEKPAECNICHKRFQQHHNLTKHLLIHLQVKPFVCEICNKKFGRIDVLNRHLLTHSIEKPFKCELCHKGFIRHHQLTNHNEKAHPEIDFDDENAIMLENMTGEMSVTLM